VISKESEQALDRFTYPNHFQKVDVKRLQFDNNSSSDLSDEILFLKLEDIDSEAFESFQDNLNRNKSIEILLELKQKGFFHWFQKKKLKVLLNKFSTVG
jgi:hypothetical protein